MRNVSTVVLAFAAGVTLMLLLTRYFPDDKPRTSSSALATAAAITSSAASEFDRPDSSSNAWPKQGPTPEQVLYAQPLMLRHALAGLTPRVSGQSNLYVVSFAGDGAEDVFGNEASYAPKLFSQRFGPTTHTLVLSNNPSSLASDPLASWSNLDAALAGVHEAMNPEQDILLLYLTSHGSEDHTLLVDLDPLPLDQIGNEDLAGILARHHFKWKVVVVNACYSGGFVSTLRGAGTLVITAARSDRSSFGCGSDSDITYFGRAWLVDGLNRTADFIDAFKQASSEIARWETQDALVPSEPQINIGSGIENQLMLWRQGITLGSPVPFKPVFRSSAEASSLPAASHMPVSAPH